MAEPKRSMTARIVFKTRAFISDFLPILFLATAEWGYVSFLLVALAYLR